MNNNTSSNSHRLINLELPLKIKPIDCDRFVEVDLNQMPLNSDNGSWTLRLSEKSERLSDATSRFFYFVVLHALNGRKKISTVSRWVNEFHLFTRSISGETDPPLQHISLEMFNRYTIVKNASQHKILRSFLLYWARLKTPGILDELYDYLDASKAPKPRGTSEIQNNEPQERPLGIEQIRGILARVDELYISGIFDPQDSLLWKLIVSLALRPSQLGLLRISDVRYEMDEKTGKQYAYLNVPIVKQHGTPARSYMMEYRMSDTITTALRQHLDFLDKTLGARPSITQPLFSIVKTNSGIKAAKDSTIRINSKITRTRPYITEKFPIFDDGDLFTRRFKHSKLTHLAMLGAPLEVLARAGYQTSTISLKHYVNLSEEAYKEYESRLDEPNREIYNAFNGRIVEPSQASVADPDHAILSRDLEETLGNCAGTPCNVFAPIGCYVCPRFEAFADADHSSVLGFLEQKIAVSKKLNSSTDTIARDAHLIAAVKSVITQIQENATLS